MAQTRARVLRGDNHFPGKVVSLFESHTEIIGKGKLAKPTEFGRLVKIQEAEGQFITDYEAAGYKEPYAAYGNYSYDAANAIINALKTSLASASDAKSARAATVDAMGKVSFDGGTTAARFVDFVRDEITPSSKAARRDAERASAKRRS